MEFINELHVNAKLSRAITIFFLALIPKVSSPQDLGHYKPIYLVGCIYKIVAFWLKSILGKIISTTQTTFIHGRDILDGVLVINMILDVAIRKKNGTVWY